MSDIQHQSIRRRDFLFGAAGLAIGAPAVVKATVSPLGTPEAAPPDAAITHAAVFPPLGFSRVGNAESWFLAPEVPGLAPEPEGGFKDGDSAIKKQVQRFRVYGFDEQGRVVRELTAADADITWDVRVANSKGAWYGFSNALDLGDDVPGIPQPLRNQFVPLEDREQALVIDSGDVRIGGADANADGSDDRYHLGGTFWNSLAVTLGHLRTDDAGRLLVFPGDGVSETALEQNTVTDFTNNDGWHDDWCDGWVKATVTLADGTMLDCEPGWVVCCGPNFAPQIPPLVTLHDTIQDVMVGMGHEARPAPPYSFRRDVLPLFHRLGLMQWVSEADFLNFNWPAIRDFSDPEYLRELADPSDAARETRQAVLAAIRDPADRSPGQALIPYNLGDGVNYASSPDYWFHFPHSKYDVLKGWAAGDFVNDFEDAVADSVQSLADLPIAQQPEALTRAALEPCSGGAFHPGVEITWPIRHAALFRTPEETPFPYRIAIGSRQQLSQYLGLQLNPTNVFGGSDGNGTDAPIGPQMPGDLTRWMGVPWHGDAFSCQYVLTEQEFPIPTWWPALLPVSVLPEAYYEQVIRPDLPPEMRTRFFASRALWSRGVAGIGYHANASYYDGLKQMLTLWPQMGMVVRRPGPTDAAAPESLPDEMYVEVQRGSVNLKQPPGDASNG
jgi:hypothetical protein